MDDNPFLDNQMIADAIEIIISFPWATSYMKPDVLEELERLGYLRDEQLTNNALGFIQCVQDDTRRDDSVSTTSPGCEDGV